MPTGRRSEGHLFILSSPSGGGKTSIARSLLRKIPRLTRSVSATTRRPRHGEKNRRDYVFISTSAFETMKRRGELLEWTTYNGQSYGTPLKQVTEALAKGRDLLLLLDVSGTLTLKKRFRNVTTIFVLPPSFQELVKRLGRRRTESAREVSRRLKIAAQELSYSKYYDHVVVNDRLSKAVLAIERIIRSARDRGKQ